MKRAGNFRRKLRSLGAIFALYIGGLAPAAAQDVTLTSRDGALAVSGQLTSYDGEFYRIASEFGPLTITSASVICDGPACPDLTAPKAVIRITGDLAAGAALLPPVIAAFAQTRGYDLRLPSTSAQPTLLLQSGTQNVLAEITFTPRSAEAARSAMADSSADLVVARFAPLDSAANLLALDALVPIVSARNPIARLSTADLAAALSGEVTNWSQIGGGDMPVVLHGLDKDSDLTAALSARLGARVAAVQSHPDMSALAAAVASDPWALAMTGRTNAAPARILPLTDSCGFVLDPSPMAVKTDDYPLTLPVYMLTPTRRLPLLTREFLEFLSLPAAQTAIASAGFVARDIETAPLGGDGARLINAIKAASDGDALPRLQKLAFAMDGADRVSFSFRFEDDTRELDLASTQHLTDLAQHIAAGRMAGRAMQLVGFVPNTGDADADYAASVLLAESVLDLLTALAPDLPSSDWPSIEGYGAGLPLACDTTAAGKRLNRRVELWFTAGGGG